MTGKDEIYPTSKPWTRWWWFSGRIEEDAIRYQLDWLKANGFGGVELAWVYPLEDSEPGPEWLGDEWSNLVAYTKRHCDKIGLGCDFTFGSRWPFGGSMVSERDASKTYKGLSGQRLELSWEDPFVDEPPLVLDHLSRDALLRYSEILGQALSKALKGSRSALFCDSWEVQTEGLWTDGFDETFESRFGYPVLDYMDDIDNYPNIRYDYRKLVSEYILNNFFEPFTEICHSLGAVSRVQCHGSPTDLLAAYASADVPESEAILFEPPFSNIAASAAALAGKKIVTAEAFTSLYGWTAHPGPSPFQKREQVADMKLVADALFANGVNHIVWHGMPYNPESGNNRFYTTVHVGPDSGFADELPEFNKYMGKISGYLRRGRSYSDIAVYLPLEDLWMRGELPDEMRTSPDAKYHWEMRFTRFPEELKGYRPIWVSNHFLRQARYANGDLICGKLSFKLLYIDSEWLDEDALIEILRLAKEGLPICLKRYPMQPGRAKSERYEDMFWELLTYGIVAEDLHRVHTGLPLIEGDDLPDFWCRVDNGHLLIFFANPMARNLKYPITYGQSYSTETMRIPIAVNIPGNELDIILSFEPYQSLLLDISPSGDYEFIDIGFQPKTPVVQ